MTAKISLFNTGIYKSTLKRYIWGSVLYFVLLFLSSSMGFLTNLGDTSVYLTHYYNTSLLFAGGNLFFAVLMAVVVPTVVAMLVFRFVHSKKNAVFVHSLPVSRTAIYVSTLAAAFTLMALPVVLNGIILMILSTCAYSDFFSIANCLVWMGVNLACLFIMFSVAVFSAIITGNTFAVPVLNILIFVFPYIISTVFDIVAKDFLYGYMSDDKLAYSFRNLNPFVLMIQIANNLDYAFAERLVLNNYLFKLVCFSAVAVVLYMLSWFLYKKRGMESAEDIAPFNVLNPIYKYFVTFIGTLVAYGIFNASLHSNVLMFFSILLIVSAIIYFACEMMLKKTMRVISALKGYLCFVLSFAAVLCILAFTTCFGYENRTPDVKYVEKATMYEDYQYFEELPFVDDSEVIEYVISTHRELVSDRTNYIEDDYVYDENSITLIIEYQLKNGSIMSRRYVVPIDEGHEILSRLYENKKYIQAKHFIFKPDEIINIQIEDTTIQEKDEIAEFVRCLRRDILDLGYSDVELSRGATVKVSVNYIYYNNDDRSNFNVMGESCGITSSHTNAVNWLKENGYEELASFIVSQ